MKAYNIKFYLKIIFAAIFLSVSGSGCNSTDNSDNEENTLFKDITVHTFGNEVKPNDVFNNDLQDLVMPITTKKDRGWLIFNVSFEDKIYKGWTHVLKLEDFNRDNGNLDLSKNQEVSQKLLKDRYFNANDEHEPPNSHLIYTKANKNEQADSNFDYGKYYDNLLKDTTQNLVYILSADGQSNQTKKLFSSVKDLRNSMISDINEYPNRKVYIVYKPEVEPGQENCNNGFDDDGDGAKDCEDGDCPPCPPQKEKCFDGLDNDKDGLVDCADKVDCNCPEPPIKEICNNGIDDNRNGKVDCADPTCNCPKPDCLLIKSSGSKFSWNNVASDVTYMYTFFDYETNEIFSSGTISSTEVNVPGSIPSGKWTILKVTAYRNGQNITRNGYKFYISNNDRKIRNGCPIEQESSKNCKD